MPEPLFDPARFQAALRTRAIGRFLTYRPVIGTTMELARREAAEGAPHGTIVLAEEQTAGRGRRGRSFYSPPGENLYFTFILRVDAARQRLLPVVVPLAVCLAVEAEGVAAAIKWPNDIWVGGRKLSGMLIDAETSAGGESICYPGIGINVNGDPTVNPELREIATSMRRELGAPVKREELLARLCNELERCLALPEAELIPPYRRRNLLLGRPVEVRPVAGVAYAAVAEEIGADGSLVVRLASGERETITAAEVSIRPAPAATGSPRSL